MIKKTAIIITGFFLYALPLGAYGGGYEGTRAGQVLKIAGGAAGPAMGGAYTAAGNDISGIHFNPAAAAGIEGFQFEVMRLEWFGDTALNHAVFGMDIGPGSAGVSYTGISIGTMERRLDDTIQHEGTFKAGDSVGSLFYGTGRGPFKAGAAIKYLHSKIDYESASAFAFDIGATAYSGSIRGGLSIRNLGTSMKFIQEKEKLPFSVSAGFCYDFLENFYGTGDINFPSDGETNAAFGAEYTLSAGSVNIPVRAGIRSGKGKKLIEASSAGAGLSHKNYTFDFAWVPYGDIGDTFRFSLKGSF